MKRNEILEFNDFDENSHQGNHVLYTIGMYIYAIIIGSFKVLET